MKNFLKNIGEKRNRISKPFLIMIFLVAAVWAYIYFSTFYIIVRFDELGRISKNMSVYYNGFKVGKIVSIEPDRDFKHTLAKVVFSVKKLNLPDNTKVELKSFPSGELYLQLVYPSSVSLKNLKRGALLEGNAPYNLEQFMLGQNISGVTDVVSIYVIRALNAMEVSNMEMKMFFENTSLIMTDNRQAINESINNFTIMSENLAEMAKNLNQMAKNLNETSAKVNRALNTDIIKGSTQNLNETTGNINEATKGLGDTMAKIDDTINHANSVAKNLDCITTGLNHTLSKRFGGMRVMFGTPVKH